VISHIFRTASRWVFFASLVYAPWAYGATTSASIRITNWLLLATLAFWCVELLVSGRRPQFPRPLVVLILALICVGGWMALNAKSVYDSDFAAFVPLPSLAPVLPGSVDYAISAAWMIRGALLLGLILFVADFSQSNRWLLRLWYVIALVGGSIACLGLLQKATGAQMIFWLPPPPEDVRVTTFFATYYYHGNAGAFLNLIWPLTAGLVIRAFTSGFHPWMRAISTSLFVLTLAAVSANTSRMAQLVAVLLLIAICLQFGPLLLRGLSRAGKSVALPGALAIVLALIAFAHASHFEQPLNRWQSASEHIPNDARWQASRVAMRALPDAGLFGFGPGTFRVVFPTYNASPNGNSQVSGTWRFLHEDYLQTVLEWGWIGTVLWALLFFGGITVGIRSYKKHGRQAWRPRRRVLQPLVIIALIGMALHAVVDFPLQIESIQLYVATYLGLCWGSTFWSDHESRATGQTKRSMSRYAANRTAL
jgi:O-Antigen ligase